MVSYHFCTSLQVLSGSHYRVRTGPGNPGKSLNFKKSFSWPGKSWNSGASESPGKS